VLKYLRDRSLPGGVLYAGLYAVFFLALSQVATLYDTAWHASENRVKFLGLPHPWTADHFLFLFSVIATLVLMTRLLAPDTGRRRGETGLAMLSFLGRRGPLGAFGVLGAVALALFALAFDSAYHWAFRFSLIGRAESTFSPPHSLARIAVILLTLSVTMLLYDLAMGSALRDNLDRLRLARLGLFLSLVWLVGSATSFIPGNTPNWDVNSMTWLAAMSIGGGVVAVAQLWPWPFPALSTVAAYVVFRAAAFGLLISNGFNGAQRPLEPMLLAALVVDLWLLLPFNRGRGVLTLVACGLLLGLVWAPFGFHYFFPFTDHTDASLRRAIIEATIAGGFGGLVGLTLSWLAKRFTQAAAGASGRPAPVTTEPVQL